MKTIKLSLVALLATSSVAFASDSLQDAFKNGTFNGAFKFTYAKGNNPDVPAMTQDPARNSNVGSVAVEFKYLTQDFYGFKLGLGFQAGKDLGFHSKTGEGTASGQDDKRNSVTGVDLHNFFLQYSFASSNIIVGRQPIKLPLLMTSGAWPMEDSFDAAVLSINEIQDTILKFAFVKQWNKRFSHDKTPIGKFDYDVHFHKPLYTLFVKNTSIPNVTLEGQYLSTKEPINDGNAPTMVEGGHDMYYAKADYKLPIDLPLSIGVMYGGVKFHNKESSNHRDDSQFYGFRATTKIADVGLKAAFTSVKDNDDFTSTIGHVPDAVLDTSMLVNNAIFAGTKAFTLEATYNFGVPALKTALKVGHFSQSQAGFNVSSTPIGKANEVNLEVGYNFSGALKGLSTRILTSYVKYSPKNDIHYDKKNFAYARWYVAYRF